MKLILVAFILSIAFPANIYSQDGNKGYIIEIEGSRVYLDYSEEEVRVGDRLQVVSEPKVMIHPITKKRIVKDGELIAILEITEVQKDYSVAGEVYPANAISRLDVGARVSLLDESLVESFGDDKVNVAIAEAKVNDVVETGYFGGYVADLLMQEMLSCEKVRLIDRSVLAAQVDETNLIESGYINSDNSILGGQISGVQYLIQVTMQRPDVANVKTGIPIHSILSAAGAVAKVAGASSDVSDGFDIGRNLSSNVKTVKLEASVSITARVIDVQTGEVMFMCTAKGASQGESQLALERGALGGLQVNGGIDGFKQTVTGKAVALAYRKIGNNLKAYFNGETTEKVINGGSCDEELQYRHGKIYMGVNKLNKSEIKEVFAESSELFFEYRKVKTIKTIMEGIGATSFVFFTVDLLSGTDDGHFRYGGITKNTGLDEPMMVASAAVFVVGNYFIGKAIMRRCVNTYNQKLRETSYRPILSFGLSPTGFKLALSF